MMDIKTYPQPIVEAVRQRLGLKANDSTHDDEIMAMSPDDVFKHVCNWQGLINYSNTIKYWVENIYGVTLK